MMTQKTIIFFIFYCLTTIQLLAQYNIEKTLAFPDAEGFGKYATGARGHSIPTVYIVSNLNDSGEGSFREAVSQPGRFVLFAVSGIIHLQSNITVSPNTTIAGQTAPGTGIVLYGRKVSFTGASNSIIRHLRIRLGANAGATKNDDASGIANGKNIIFDHVSFSWGQDEVFSINWNMLGVEPDSITLQNCIIAQGLHIHNHSAGGLIQTQNGHISILKSLYISNKTRNPKVKGYSEFVNNVIYNWGNSGNNYGHSVSGEGYIMGGSTGISKVNIINNYFIAGPNTPNKQSPFSRGTGTFHLYTSGNLFDNNKDGILDGVPVSTNKYGFPGISNSNFKKQAYQYPYNQGHLNTKDLLKWISRHAGATLPKRDDVDLLLIKELNSIGQKGIFVFTEKDNKLSNGGLGIFESGNLPIDSDKDGIPDIWEKTIGSNPTKKDALEGSTSHIGYLNIEVFINEMTAL
ncbi:MAG: hypothetical protein ACK5NK_13380 [Niabella sp.]